MARKSISKKVRFEVFNALRKVGGICYNRKKQRGKNAEQDY